MVLTFVPARICALQNRFVALFQEEITVLGRIGEGAFGEVSLATSPIFGQVAIKWLKPGKVRCL